MIRLPEEENGRRCVSVVFVLCVFVTVNENDNLKFISQSKSLIASAVILPHVPVISKSVMVKVRS